MYNEIDNTKDIIDSRDIIERIKELYEGLELNELEGYEKDEYEALTELKKQCGYSNDWIYGLALIHEDYFTEYCEDLCKSCGYLSDDIPFFISNNINWEGIADDLLIDYSEADFDGQTYYFRLS